MHRTSVIFLACLFLVGSVPGAEAEKSETGGDRTDSGGAERRFVSIFDGRTLDGWRGATTGYACEAGVLVCQKQGGGRLFTVKEFGDFVFRFDYRLEPGGNNGISVRGHEIQVLDDDRRSTRTSSPASTTARSIAPCLPNAGTPSRRANGIRKRSCARAATGKFVNGVVIVDVDLTAVPGQEALAKRTSGPLGFLGYGPASSSATCG